MVPFLSSADDISKLELLARCYRDITNMPLVPYSPEAKQVKAGTLDPINFCIQKLHSANFDITGTINPSTDVTKQNILKHFNRIHETWFSVRDFSHLNGNEIQGSYSFHESGVGALYMTKSLFTPSMPFSDTLKGTQSLQSKRAKGESQTSPFNFKPNTDFKLGNNTNNTPWTAVKLVDTGPLIGVVPSRSVTATTLIGTSTATVQRTNINMLESWGGGLIGTMEYLLLNMQEPVNYAINGADKVPRKWARYLYQDLLCRELPVIRQSDAKPFVRQNSSISFRQSKSCTHCHASMDRTAGVLRNYKGTATSNINASPKVRRPALYIVNKPAEDWPDEPSTTYYRSPPSGWLYFRNLHGELIHEKVSNIEELGSAISNQIDFYACAAKRYYKYFTGIDVNLTDIYDPGNPITLNSTEKYHRDFIIDLSYKFKSHKNQAQLIESILRSPAYKKKDYLLRSLASDLPEVQSYE